MAHFVKAGDLLSVKVDDGASADVTVVSAVAGKEIRVYGMMLTLDLEDTLNFKDGATSLTGDMTLSSIVLEPVNIGDQRAPWFTCTANTAFVITKGTAGRQLSGRVYYTQN